MLYLQRTFLRIYLEQTLQKLDKVHKTDWGAEYDCSALAYSNIEILMTRSFLVLLRSFYRPLNSVSRCVQIGKHSLRKWWTSWRLHAQQKIFNDTMKLLMPAYRVAECHVLQCMCSIFILTRMTCLTSMLPYKREYNIALTMLVWLDSTSFQSLKILQVINY